MAKIIKKGLLWIMLLSANITGFAQLPVPYYPYNTYLPYGMLPVYQPYPVNQYYPPAYYYPSLPYFNQFPAYQPTLVYPPLSIQLPVPTYSTPQTAVDLAGIQDDIQRLLKMRLTDAAFQQQVGRSGAELMTLQAFQRQIIQRHLIDSTFSDDVTQSSIFANRVLKLRQDVDWLKGAAYMPSVR